MAKKRKMPNRARPTRAVTISSQLVTAAMKIAVQQMPPIHTVSRMLDEAMADYIIAHGPKGKGAK